MPLPASILRQLRTATLLPLAVLAAAGCEPDLGVPATVTVRYREVAPLTRDRLVVTVDDADSGWYFEGVDFEPATDGWLTSRSLDLSASGGVRVLVALRGSATTTAAASGEIVLPATANERWLVDIFPSELAPNVVCGGCAGLARFAITESDRPAARDWLYVRWTGSGGSPTGPR